ncbi:MAG TPA: hypothetical protein VEY68_15035 [Anoxybacillus sp.]|jgi:SNF2 family DNA or RNA helicase|nr:hypothetical protein [Anoxybacillus sp.]
MKKIILSLLSGILLMVVCNMGGVQAAKLTKTEEKILNTITKDFINTHNITVDGYNFIPIKASELYKDNLTAEQKSLLNVFISISEKQIIGDFSPIFYLNKENKNGFVLEKKLSGMNNLYYLSFDDKQQEWKITDKSSKKGSDLVDLGLLKSAD